MDEKVKLLLDRVKDTAAAVGGMASTTARYAGRCASQMVDVAKLNVQLFDLNGEFNEILRQLGQVMYDTHTGADNGADVAALLSRADETAARAAEVKGRIADLRHAQDCPVCGASCGKDDKFCRVCGAEL